MHKLLSTTWLAGYDMQISVGKYASVIGKSSYL